MNVVTVGGLGDGKEYVLRKLPRVTVSFWALKTVAVTLGETAGDLLGITFQFGYAATTVVFAVFFLSVVTAQVRAGRSHLALYWAVVLATSMVCTEISDFLNAASGTAALPTASATAPARSS